MGDLIGGQELGLLQQQGIISIIKSKANSKKVVRKEGPDVFSSTRMRPMAGFKKGLHTS